MIQIELHKIIPPHAMGQTETKVKRICIPMDLIGVLEETEENNTEITLRGGMKSIIIQESIDEVKEKINEIMIKMAQARSGGLIT